MLRPVRLAPALVLAALPALPSLSCGPPDPAARGGARAATPVEPPAGEVAPDPPDARLDAVEGALARGDFPAAQRVAEEVLADHPGHGLARLLHGIALHKQLLYALARPEFEAVIRGGPTFEKYDAAWYFLGWALYNLGELDEARRAFEEHLSRVPDEGDSHFALGLIEMDGGAEDAALGRFRRSIELNVAEVEAGNESRAADVAKAHARIADILMLREETEAAVRELEQCVTLWPAHYNAWFKLYRAHTLLGNEEKAAQSLKQHDHWKATSQGDPAGRGPRPGTGGGG